MLGFAFFFKLVLFITTFTSLYVLICKMQVKGPGCWILEHYKLSGVTHNKLPAIELSPFEPRYQMTLPYALFHSKAPTELTRAMTRRMQNNTRICMLVTFSTFDLFKGALVEFWTKAETAVRTGLDKGITTEKIWKNLRSELISWSLKPIDPAIMFLDTFSYPVKYPLSPRVMREMWTVCSYFYRLN